MKTITPPSRLAASATAPHTPDGARAERVGRAGRAGAMWKPCERREEDVNAASCRGGLGPVEAVPSVPNPSRRPRNRRRGAPSSKRTENVKNKRLCPNQGQSIYTISFLGYAQIWTRSRDRSLSCYLLVHGRTAELRAEDRNARVMRADAGKALFDREVYSREAEGSTMISTGQKRRPSHSYSPPTPLPVSHPRRRGTTS